MTMQREEEAAGVSPGGPRVRLGQAGERAAEAYLVSRGYAVLDRNWRCREGEIDLVARRGETIAIVEVKTRRSLVAGHPLEAVTPVKLARLRRLAGHWAAAHPEQIGRLRLDAISVLGAPGNAVIEHVEAIGA